MEDEFLIETIRNNCDIDEDGHWIWRGRQRYYGAPCMAFRRETRPVRQVLMTLMGQHFQPGIPLVAECGNALCVAPKCIRSKTNADLMTEARKKKSQEKGMFTRLIKPVGIWDQLIKGTV